LGKACEYQISPTARFSPGCWADYQDVAYLMLENLVSTPVSATDKRILSCFGNAYSIAGMHTIPHLACGLLWLDAIAPHISAPAHQLGIDIDYFGAVVVKQFIEIGSLLTAVMSTIRTPGRGSLKLRLPVFDAQLLNAARQSFAHPTEQRPTHFGSPAQQQLFVPTQSARLNNKMFRLLKQAD